MHHDVKPRNVLFDTDGTVKVTDFGIARAASSDITTVQGSPPYLAPEQARGGQSDRRSDIYALGCVIFEMLAGRPPFEGDSSSAVIMQHIDTPAPALSRFRTDVPRELEQAVARALAKDPVERYDSPAALRADLTRIAGGMGGTLIADAGDTIVSTAGGMPQDATLAYDDWDDAPAEYTRDHDDYRDEEPRRRRGMSARTVAILLAAVLLLIVVAMAFSDFGGTETADQAPVASEAPADPEAQQETADQQDGTQNGNGDGGNAIERRIDSLNRAADRLQELAEQGQQADEATQRRIDELRRQLDEALAGGGAADGSGNGGGDGSSSESGAVEALRDRLNDLASDSEQAGDSVADRLRQLVDELNPFSG